MSTTIIASTTSFTSTTASSTSSPSLFSSAFTATPTASSLANSQLTAISKISELHQLRDLYRRDWPAHCVGYYCLNNFIDWMEKRQQLNSVEDMKNLQIFTLDNDWHSDGLFLIVDRYQLMIGALDTEEAAKELKIALPQLDWSRGYKMTGAPAVHFETIVQVLTELGLSMNYIRLKVMSLQREEICKLNIRSLPPELEFRQLSLTDATIVNDIWYSRQNGSLEFIKRLITYNHTIGIYTKSIGELIAWCIRCNLGLLGMLHVKEDYRGRGFATAIVQQLASQIADAGADAVTMIGERNIASVGLFKKLNFKELCFTYIIRTKRGENVEMWSDELEAKECWSNFS